MKKPLVPFAYGFRPFFLLAGLYGLVAIGLWLLLYRGQSPIQAGPIPQFWHGHEMLFGFIAAAITGFMLTAVPSWTGKQSISGAPLALLSILWLCGRLAFSLQTSLPWAAVLIAELVFLPTVITMLAPALLGSGKRNAPLLLVLLLFWSCDLTFMITLSNGNIEGASSALRAALNLSLVLITIVGGRIVPTFTSNALKSEAAAIKIASVRPLELAVIIAMLVYAFSDVIAPASTGTAGIALVAGVLQFWRLSRWHGLKTLSQPIVWVLHLAYLWLPVGLILKAIFVTTNAPWAAHWMHALGAGAAGMMIMAVMTRASLGHTGRKLKVAPIITAAYLLMAAAVVIRVFGPGIWPADYPNTIAIAGYLWILAFGCYAIVYAPILLLPRADGKAG